MSAANGAPKKGTVVAIDGPAGAGKSTVARELAEDLGLAYVNTGIMYRTVAHEALRREIDPGNGSALAEIAEALTFSLDESEPPQLLVGGSLPPEAINEAEVEGIVSTVAAHPSVRATLRAAQRRLGSPGAVVEGRDIGTVVFPDADVKIFLQADPDERVGRRQAERGSADPELARALERRDEMDSRVNPLVPAEDAVSLDTSGRELADVLAEVRGIVARALEQGSTR